LKIDVFPKIIPLGDKKQASKLWRAGIKEYAILQGLNFQGLAQDERKTVYSDGVIIKCKKYFNEGLVEIYVPPKEEVKEEVLEEEKGALYYFIVLSYRFPVGVVEYEVNLCTVYDIKLRKVADTIPLNGGAGMATFPCDPNLISDWHDYKSLDVADLYLPPLLPFPLFDQDDEGYGTEWDSVDGDAWPEDPNCNITDVTNRSQVLTRIDGADGTFNDEASWECVATTDEEEYYNSSSRDCAIYHGNDCSDFSEGTFKNLGYYRKLKIYECLHGLPIYAGAYYENPNPDFYFREPAASLKLIFDYGYTGKLAYYCTHVTRYEYILSDVENTKEWEY